mmetsp:Transcript_28741/g.42566  ORF Transcript_28741/g.42566 Transcript_28741/m.42566 type:complete len:90 (+) Transcript_28741:1083-1352(+)
MGITVRGSEERVVADLTRGFFVEPIAELGLGVQKTRSDPLDGAERGPPDVDMAAEDRAIGSRCREEVPSNACFRRNCCGWVVWARPLSG